ncbi:MAG: enoyl-CoA hydratase/isomerase family protein [Dehalococcoidia bacterium]
MEVSDGVAVLTLDRPASMNALNRELALALVEAFERICDDDGIRVGVVTGNGRAFCAGADLKERAATGAGSGGLVAGTPSAFFASPQTQTAYSVDTRKPMIAAVNGHCLGGGLELALACDLRIAAEGARFGLPEITRGFFPGGGAPVRLPRAIPRAVAMDLLLTGEPIDAAAALRAGLVSRVVPADELQTTALGMARRIAGYAPLAVRAAREVVHTQDGLPTAEALRFSASLRWIIGQTSDADEGPQAFAEGRDPQYRGE